MPQHAWFEKFNWVWRKLLMCTKATKTINFIDIP